MCKSIISKYGYKIVEAMLEGFISLDRVGLMLYVIQLLIVAGFQLELETSNCHGNINYEMQLWQPNGNWSL